MSLELALPLALPDVFFSLGDLAVAPPWLDCAVPVFCFFAGGSSCKANTAEPTHIRLCQTTGAAYILGVTSSLQLAVCRVWVRDIGMYTPENDNDVHGGFVRGLSHTEMDTFEQQSMCAAYKRVLNAAMPRRQSGVALPDRH